MQATSILQCQSCTARDRPLTPIPRCSPDSCHAGLASTQLGQASGSLATLKAQRDQVQADLESKEDELERVAREYKENVPRAAAVEAVP